MRHAPGWHPHPLCRDTMQIYGRKENLSLDLTNIREQEVILRIPWLEEANLVINWKTGELR